MKIGLFVFAILLSIQSCGDSKSNNSNTDQNGVEQTSDITFGKPFKLHYNQPLEFADPPIKITFNDLKDSRCPKNTNCIQEGKATATVAVDMKDTDTENITFTAKGLCYNDYDACGTMKRVKGYKVVVYNIYPYPETGVKRDKNEAYMNVMISE